MRKISRRKLSTLAKHEKKEAKTMHRMGLHQMARREKANARGLIRLARKRY